MKDKHIDIRIKQCLINATASNCPRLKVGAILLDPHRNVILMDGYNGGPRGGSSLCGDSSCLRNDLGLKSGSNLEIGCVHAEQNVIYNAANVGIKTAGSWLFITAEACLMCAKAIHHAGIEKVIVIGGQYSSKDGMEYLSKHGISIEYRSGN